MESLLEKWKKMDYDSRKAFLTYISRTTWCESITENTSEKTIYAFIEAVLREIEKK